jgi:hypothetical protein
MVRGQQSADAPRQNEGTDGVEQDDQENDDGVVAMPRVRRGYLEATGDLQEPCREKESQRKGRRAEGEDGVDADDEKKPDDQHSSPDEDRNARTGEGIVREPVAVIDR